MAEHHRAIENRACPASPWQRYKRVRVEDKSAWLVIVVVPRMTRVACKQMAFCHNFRHGSNPRNASSHPDPDPRRCVCAGTPLLQGEFLLQRDAERKAASRAVGGARRRRLSNRRADADGPSAVASDSDDEDQV